MDTRFVMRTAMLWSFLVLPAVASAQVVGSGISGAVRDSSGGVLPGVTVEAASPALIERIRSAVTDGQGRYQILDVRPGIYTVTFSLSGFSTLRREELELPAGFTATVNADMKVGAIEETITVTGTAPIVDTQNPRNQTTIARTTLEAIPGTGRLSQMVAILPGAVLGNATLQNVGGVSDRTQTAWSMHGATGAETVMDGMNQSAIGGGAATYIFNNLTFQEVVLEVSGTSAERSTGGVQMNIVPRDGGNQFSGTFSTAHATRHLESDNLTDELRARGLQPTPATKKIYDTGGGLGGPIMRDRLWFFGAVRVAVNQQYQQGNFYNKVHGTFLYEPDLSRQAFTNDYTKDYSLRLTWQAAQKHKIVVATSVQPNCNCSYQLLNPGALRTPEAAGQHHYNPNGLPSANWTYPATNRILVEVGGSANIFFNQGKRQPETGDLIPPITDTGFNIIYGSRGDALGNNGGSYSVIRRQHFNTRAALSFVTGSHAFKTGLDLRNYRILAPNSGFNNPNQINQARDYTFVSGVPQSVRIWAIPHGWLENARDIGLYAQDQWILGRATINMGLRYNDFMASTPEQQLPAGPWVPARTYAATKNVPHWRNLNPRFGVAYDLFGTGKTALKGSIGRYTPGLQAAASNPALNQAHSTSRNWNDSFFGPGDPRTGNFVPDCDLRDPAINGECQRWSDLGFGQPRVVNSTNAKDSLEGFNLQDYNWQGSVTVQHQLMQQMALNVGYFRTWYGNFQATDNLSATPADYDEFCVTVPVDDRLPNSGEQLCGLYDQKPAVFGQINNLVTQASNYGKQTQIYNGVDVSLTTRFGQGGQFSGGFSVGRTVTDNCAVIDSPQQAREGFCSVTPPWDASTQIKFLVVYPLPWGVQTSAVYQNVPGIPITATYVVRNAAIRPTLGRDLGSCRGAATCNGQVTVDLIAPSTLFEDRLQQVDVRFARVFKLGRTAKVKGNFDINNLLNAGNVLNLQTRYSLTDNAWLNARQILGGRLAKISVQFDF